MSCCDGTHRACGLRATFGIVGLWPLTAISIWLWMGVLRWRPPPIVPVSVILLVLSSPQIAQGLRLRQFGLLVAFLIALAGWCVTREHYFIGGALLAVATIKPQMVALCVAWFLMWSVGEWKKRWPLPRDLRRTQRAGGCGRGLASAGMAAIFLLRAGAYRRYFPTTSPLRLVFGDWAGGMVSVFIVVGVAAYSWRKKGKSQQTLTNSFSCLHLFSWRLGWFCHC